MSALVLILAAVTGALHVAGVARAARRARTWMGGLGRLILSGAVLAASARAHHLGAAVLGWAGGWLANGVREYRRMS
jgi:hypothetical protein